MKYLPLSAPPPQETPWTNGSSAASGRPMAPDTPQRASTPKIAGSTPASPARSAPSRQPPTGLPHQRQEPSRRTYPAKDARATVASHRVQDTTTTRSNPSPPVRHPETPFPPPGAETPTPPGTPVRLPATGSAGPTFQQAFRLPPDRNLTQSSTEGPAPGQTAPPRGAHRPGNAPESTGRGLQAQHGQRGPGSQAQGRENDSSKVLRPGTSRGPEDAAASSTTRNPPPPGPDRRTPPARGRREDDHRKTDTSPLTSPRESGLP